MGLVLVPAQYSRAREIVSRLEILPQGLLSSSMGEGLFTKFLPLGTQRRMKAWQCLLPHLLQENPRWISALCCGANEALHSRLTSFSWGQSREKGRGNEEILLLRHYLES